MPARTQHSYREYVDVNVGGGKGSHCWRRYGEEKIRDKSNRKRLYQGNSRFITNERFASTNLFFSFFLNHCTGNLATSCLCQVDS